MNFFYLSKTICYLSQINVQLIILLMFFFKKKYQWIYSSILICTTSGLLNGAIKPLFHVPLMSHLGNGFAFPSGHLQMSTVFYGYMCQQRLISKKWFIPLMLILAWGIYDQHYHTPIELLAGFITGSMVLIVFSQTPLLRYPSIILVCNTFFILFIVYQQFYPTAYIGFYLCSLILLFLLRHQSILPSCSKPNRY